MTRQSEVAGETLRDEAGQAYDMLLQVRTVSLASVCLRVCHLVIIGTVCSGCAFSPHPTQCCAVLHLCIPGERGTQGHG